MHEASLVRALVRKIIAVARAQQAGRVVGVHVKLGALSHISPDHLVRHFEPATYGTIAEGARLEIDLCADTEASYAQEMLLDSIEVEA